MDVLTSRILLRPRDPARSRAFYRDIMGLAVAREFGDPDDPCVVFHLGGGYLEVSSTGAPAPDGPGLWLQVRDVHAEHDRLRTRGAVITRPPAVEPWGLIEMWVADPDGVAIAVVEVPAGHPLRRDLRSVRPQTASTGGADDQGNSIQADVDRQA